MKPDKTSLKAHILGVFAMTVAVIAAPSEVRAQVTPDELGLSFVTSAQYKRAKPMIVLSPSITVRSVLFDCKRSDGKRVRLTASNIREGRTKKIVIPQGKGIFQYACKLSGKAKSGAIGPFAMDPFEIKVGEPPRFGLNEHDVNEAARTITLRCSERKGKVELVVQDDEGEVIDEVEQPFDVAPGQPIVVKWKQREGQVMGNFTLKVYDQVGFFSGIESITFVNIPHDDIIFESGKWQIPKAEEAKLVQPLQRIKAALAKVKGILPIKLYIGGYTDTVGSDADNMELSRKRAASIAAWFKRHKVGAPIFFQGFGERALFVKTPDNTPEKRNRRAAYVLSKDMPPASRGFPARRWTAAR